MHPCALIILPSVKMNSSVALFFFLCLIASPLLLNCVPTAAESVTCDPMQLSPCAGAILSSAKPTDACCDKLKEQKPCFCKYEKNPKLQGYINSANGKRVAATCRIPMPKC